MGVIESKMGRKFEQKRKAKWVKNKANLYMCIYIQTLMTTEGQG